MNLQVRVELHDGTGFTIFCDTFKKTPGATEFCMAFVGGVPIFIILTEKVVKLEAEIQGVGRFNLPLFIGEATSPGWAANDKGEFEIVARGETVRNFEDED